MFLGAAADLGIEPRRAVVVEDALSGVAAGRAGRFAAVVGVDRGAGPEQLLAHGADLVVDDLAELVPGVLSLRPRAPSSERVAPS
jgi:beta-phosphoglucomutase-like phosphatase (HAD superfamily)